MRINAVSIGLLRLALALIVLGGVPSLAAAQQQSTGAAPASSATRTAGVIELAAGDAMIESSDGTARLPRVGERVSEGDTIVTFAGGELHLHMEDGAYLSVRENSRVRIAKYVAEGGKSDASLLELLRGSLRSVTGWIGKYNRAAYQINTPTATIGVRGTDHEPTVILAGDPRGEPGTYDRVNEGRTVLQSGSHAVEVSANQAAFHAAAGTARPRVLASVPAFFRPTAHERRFVARSREVRQTVDTRRVERQQAARRGPDARPAAPPKTAPAGARPGATAPATSPRSATSVDAKPMAHAGKAEAAAKRPGVEGWGGPAALYGRPAPGEGPARRWHEGAKSAPPPARAPDPDPERARRPSATSPGRAGEGHAPRGAAGPRH